MKKVFLQKGFTLVETLVGVAVFAIVSLSAYNGFLGAMNALSVLGIKNSSLQIANEQIEIIKNLSYDDIGIKGSLPDGVIDQAKTETRNNINFNVTTTIRNIDLEFDGTIGGTPNDTSPADNKLVEVEVVCENCKYKTPTILTANIAPKNLETQGKNGALFVQVVDSTGAPIQDADVLIQNISTENPFVVNDKTNINGMLQLVDAATGTNAYFVQVSKDGYSSDKTYSLSDPQNPNPNVLYANVLQGLVTRLSFSIDKLSELNVSTKKSDCSSVTDVDFNIKGNKTIGQNVYKYNKNLFTSASGVKTISDIEWDTYDINLIDSNYFLAGSIPMIPFSVEPDSTKNIELIVKEKNANALLVNVKNFGNSLPISGAVVTLTKNSFEEEKITGKGYFYQTDWSNGSGQSDFSDSKKYYSDNNYVETNSPQGEVKLIKVGENYFNNAELISSIIDTGTTSNFSNISWAPYDQNPLTGNNPIKVQFASSLLNTSTTTWNFLGPDGTANSFYTNAGEPINSVHNGDIFARYKLFLSTDNDAVSPNLSEISFAYSSECTPPGQVYFDGLSAGEYNLTVEKTGYQTVNTTVSITNDWQAINVDLNP